MPEFRMPVSEYPGNEIVFGLCYALGTNVEPVVNLLTDYIGKYFYEPRVVRISEYLQNLQLDISPDDGTPAGRMHHLIDAGNKACEQAQRRDFLALAAVAQISQARTIDAGQRAPFEKTVQIIRSLKRPEEVDRLRRIYRSGFYLISIFATETERHAYLENRKNLSTDQATGLIKRDLREQGNTWGQRTEKTFPLGDVFVQLASDNYDAELLRFLDLVFGERFISPRRDEYGMFLASAAAARSSQPGRQVGAAILNAVGDVLAVGCNEVPRAQGGSYWEPEADDPTASDRRDHRLEPPCDSNDEAKQEIAESIVEQLSPVLKEGTLPKVVSSLLARTKLADITEYGRATHGEMDALMACARTGVSPAGATLYVTTFPCHNCARHIIAAGIRKVVYVEPYPKSRAGKLHGDAIEIGEQTGKVSPGEKIPFVPFLGVGTRRYLDFFSMEMGNGSRRLRKDDDGRGLYTDFKRSGTSGPRVPLLPTSYIEREELAVKEIYETMERLEGGS
ncbi:MAG: cytidine deaminase [Acidobacteriia bacterium]|nr:cytidine deaminase [Terriglobia bacterium]